MNPEQKDILVRVGAAVIMAQSVEEIMRFTITYVLQKDGPLTLEKLERQTTQERKKTLGYFVNELRTRADLDENFDNLLDEFLEQRNDVVHRLSDIPGWSLETVEGRKIARSFVENFIRTTVEIRNVFFGLVRAWQEQAGFDIQVPVEHDLLAEIDSGYKTRVDDIFFEKDS